MKKMVSIMMILMVIFMAVSAFAENWMETVDIVYEWAKNNGYKNGVIMDDENTYQFVGLIDVITIENDCGTIEGADWQNLESWFDNWYPFELEKRYPEYGEINTETKELDQVNGIRIYKIEVIAENDLVDWCEGEQNRVIMICSAYRRT